MSASIVPADAPLLEAIRPNRTDTFARRVVLSHLKGLRQGRITLEDSGERYVFGGEGADQGLAASVSVYHPRFYTDLLLGGSVGAGEAYMAGFWKADDLTKVVRIVLRNQDVLEAMDRGIARLKAPAYKLYHWLHRDTRKGSKANIAAHYDLGNDFYRLFLDETMTYSCGVFEKEDASLKEASLAKYDRICRKLQLAPAEHILEIGTGWGGFALHAARNYGCRITTTTISKEQFDLVRDRVREARLEDRVEVILEDYRDLKGRYDKAVSIEMIEAVGHQYLETFLSCCSRLLKGDGMMAIQAITILDAAFERHKQEVDFIKRYIFPGSCIPSVAAMAQALARGTDLRLFHLEDITPHYVRTLRTWRENFFQNLDRVRALGYSDSFIRMWEFYLSYCEAGFEERYLGDVQMLLTKPLCRRDPILPSLQ
jgi:cyclopropane-fatty-acyl-phospholipid synthase